MRPIKLLHVALTFLFLAFMNFAAGCDRGKSVGGSLSQGALSGWDVYGGSWSPYEGGVRNNSNARGAKLILRNQRWRDVKVDVDLQEIGSTGDAGVILRVNDVEEGVDAYNGYYVGLRRANGTLIIGRANHGWIEYKAIALPRGVIQNHWYHLAVAAYGCGIVARATDLEDKESASVGMQEIDCVPTGGIGLRSYSSGGIWKNLKVQQLSAEEWNEQSKSEVLAHIPEGSYSEQQINGLLLRRLQTQAGAAAGTSLPPNGLTITPLGDIALNATLTSKVVRVRGSVTLASREIYIQDSSGAAILRDTHLADAHIGDELEVIGVPEVSAFSTVFARPSVRSIRSREPLPPVSVSLVQIASGEYANRYVEIQATFLSTERASDGTAALECIGDGQRFTARLLQSAPGSPPSSLLPNSVIRLRGVAAVTPEATHAFQPFVLLLRSGSDVAVLSGPPFWTARHIAELSSFSIALLVAAVIIYLQAERWRLHAVTEERSRLAREIHDTLAQSFSAIAFQLESILSAPLSGRSNDEPIRLAMKMAKQSRKDAHLTITTLRTMQSESSLDAMIGSLLEPICGARNVKFSLTTTGISIPILPDVAHQVLRIVQEAASNAVRHSGCTALATSIVFNADSVEVTVADNGSGLGSKAQENDFSHFGVLGMRERARAIHGSLQIVSGLMGTQIVLRFPKGSYQGHSALLRSVEKARSLWRTTFNGS